MNVQIGKLAPPSEGSNAPRTAPSAGSTAREKALAPQPQAAAAAQPASIETTRQVARQINDFLKSSSSGVEFSVDDESSQVVVRVVDSQTKQVIRQIPSEEMLAISKSLDKMIGLLVQQRA